MPGVNASRAGKNGLSKTAARKVAANTRMLEAATAGDLDESHQYARIQKALGFSQMTIKLPDGTETMATIRGALKGGGRSAPTRMGAGDVVLVEKMMGDEKVSGHLIVGVLDAKRISALRKSDAIPDWMARKGDAVMGAGAGAAGGAAAAAYVFAGEEEAEAEAEVKEEEKGGKGKGRRAKASAASSDDEIDVSKI
jgi:translation initiation factor IF-1